MSKTVKLAIAGALAGVGLLCQPAFADINLPSTGNGELTLFVFDQTTSTSYARGLGVNIDSVFSRAQVIGDATYTPGKALPFSLGTVNPDPNLTTFLASTHSTDSVTWAVLAGDTSTTSASTLGAQRYVTTTLSTETALGTPSNLGLRSNYSTINSMDQGANSFINSGVADDKASAQPNGAYGTSYPSAVNWFGSGPNNGVNVGSSGNFYLFANSGTGLSGHARFYTLAGLTLSSTGVLSSAPVPLPAAVWLFGSGLLGLAGIGRRKLI